MDSRVRGLLQCIQTQLGSVLRDSAVELSSTTAECWVQNSRSPNQFKPDESGISSEEGCLPQPVYAKLTDIATLFDKLEQTLEPPISSKQVGDGGDVTLEDDPDSPSVQFSPTPSPELVVLGPPGTQPWTGKTLARYDSGTSVVYSRRSSQFLAHGKLPTPAQVTCKDSCDKRRAMVTVDIPKKGFGDRRWTRAGTRAITKVRPLGMSYFEESGTSSEYSSSDGESCVFRANFQRKKRVRRKKQDSKGGHSCKSDRERVDDSPRSISSVDEDGGDPGSKEDTMEEDGLDGGFQMECEVGGDSESPNQTLSLPSLQADCCKPPSLYSRFGGVPVVTSPSGIYTVYEDLNEVILPNKVKFSFSAKSTQRAAVSGRICSNRYKTKLRQCTVNVTRLPRHLVNQSRHTVVKTSASSGNDRMRRGDSCESSSSTTSTSSSDSLSMLLSQSYVVSTTPESRETTSGHGASVKLTPRRLGDGRKSPVARRSFPFSKPPRTLTHLSATAVETAHSTTPTTSPSYTTPAKSPATLAKSPTTPARSPTTLARSLTTPTKSSTTPAKPVSHTAASLGTTTKTFTPTTPASSKKSSSIAGVSTVPVDWSSDEDFKVTPRPSFILSPTVLRAAHTPSSSSSPRVQKERDGGASSKLSPRNDPSPPTPGVSSSESNTALSAARGRPDSGEWCTKTHDHSLVRAAAHSMTDDTPDTDEPLPAVITCAGCGKSIYWQTQQIHKHKRLDVLICQTCWGLYHTGSFEVVEGSEIYCTMCGDGGDIVCCDTSTCTSSFCQSCIQRIGGEEYLQKLLDDSSALWHCFCCDKTPLEKYDKLCSKLCEYYLQEKQRKKLQGKTRLDDDTASNSLSHLGALDHFTAKLRGVEGETMAGGGDGCGEKTAGQSSGGGSENEDRASGEKGKDGDGSGGKASGNGGGQGSRKGGRSSGGGGGDGKKPNQSSPIDLSESEMDSSSCEEDDDSPVVDTDDVSISDMSLFDNSSFKRKKTGTRNKQETSANETVLKNEEWSSASSATKTSRQSKKKAKRSLFGVSSRRTMLSSDSDSNFESFSKTSRVRVRVLSSVSSSSSSRQNREENEGKKKKKKCLLNIVSSESDNERSPQKIQMRTSREFDDDQDNLTTSGCFSVSQDRPIVYTTTSREITISSDSDEVTVLERKQKCSNRLFGSDSNSGCEGTTLANKTPEKSKNVKMKKTRKRKKGSSEDDFESGDGWMPVRGAQLKRRRVARALSSDSDDDSEAVSGEEAGKEEEEEGEEEKNTPGRKRKKIRRLFTDAKLQASTKEAQRVERERIERLKKRQASMKEKEDELILEEDVSTKKPLVKVRQSLVKAIKPHQWEGIRFLYDSCVEKLQMFKEGKTQSGAILAHCMGLGKTLQVIAFIDALLMHEESGVERVLILCPVNTIYNWRSEIERWIPSFECDYHIYLLVDSGMEARSRKLERWYSGGGILLVGYEMFRNLVIGKRLKKKKREAFEKYLLDPGPDIIVCDEGHVMRNAASHLSMVLQRVRTLTRIVLTGTPMQNNLVEYHTMVSFVKPNLLGTLKEFKNRFVNPITNGQCQDSSPADVRLMKNRAHVLHIVLSGTVQRRDYRVLARFLPPKQEFVLFIRLSPVQERLYTRYLGKSPGQHTASDLFSTFSNLQKVWNHPWVLKLDEDRKFEREERKRSYDSDGGSSLDGFIVSGSGLESEEEEEVRKKKKKRKLDRPSSSDPAGPSSSTGPSRSLTPSLSHTTASPDSNPTQPTSTTMVGSSDEDEINFPAFSIKPDPDAKPTTALITSSNEKASSKSPQAEHLLTVGNKSGNISRRSSSPRAWYDEILTRDCDCSIEMSGKLIFLLELLQEAGKLKEKVLVFTQSLLTLDLIEEVLSWSENGEWTPGLDYYRLDGSTRSEMRTHQMSEFNEVENEQLRLYLISTRAGSLGVNLVAANRVVIFDACWNPSYDLQAVFRTYRFGQTKPIFVYRLLAKGTMEEKIYDRQVTKESLAMRVVDEKQIGRHYSASDLAELFKYSPAPPPPPKDERPTYDKPQTDIVLQSILDHLQPDWVTTYHEHDSLLEHVFSEELSEEERKAAWAEYREQITKYDNATYYNALQTQLDASAQPAELVPQLASGSSAGPSMKMERGIAQIAPSSHQANELLTVLSNTNRNVQNLIQLLREKEKLAATLAECQRHRVPISPNVTAMLAENGKKIAAHYPLVEEGVRRVNITLEKCHYGQFYLEPGANKLANDLRSKLIKSLEILRSGSTKPVARTNEVGSGASGPMQHPAALLHRAHQVAQATRAAHLEHKASGLNG